MLHYFDCAVLGLLLLIPIFLVWRWNRWGVLIGTLLIWWGGVMEGWLLNALDPNHHTTVADGAWLLFGWLGGLIYCYLIAGLKALAIHARRTSKSGPSQTVSR